MGTLSIYPSYPQFKDANGALLNDGKIYVGTAGLDPIENQISLYWDSALSIPASQPVSTINGYPSNSGSRGMLYMSGTDYSLTVLDKNNVEIYSSLNLTDINYAASSTVSGQVTTNTADIATNTADIATNTSNIGTNTTKLATIETGADVTDSTNVNAAGATMNTDTSLTGNSYFLDEDDMSSDDPNKAASQQSIRAYVDANSGGIETIVAQGTATATAIDTGGSNTKIGDITFTLPAGREWVYIEIMFSTRVAGGSGASINYNLVKIQSGATQSSTGSNYGQDCAVGGGDNMQANSFFIFTPSTINTSLTFDVEAVIGSQTNFGDTAAQRYIWGKAHHQAV